MKVVFLIVAVAIGFVECTFWPAPGLRAERVHPARDGRIRTARPSKPLPIEPVGYAQIGANPFEPVRGTAALFEPFDFRQIDFGNFDRPFRVDAFRAVEPVRSQLEEYHTDKYHRGPPYNFAWSVNFSPFDGDYGHRQSSDGRGVTGSHAEDVKYEAEVTAPVLLRTDADAVQSTPAPDVRGPVATTTPVAVPERVESATAPAFEEPIVAPELLSTAPKLVEPVAAPESAELLSAPLFEDSVADSVEFVTVGNVPAPAPGVSVLRFKSSEAPDASEPTTESSELTAPPESTESSSELFTDLTTPLL